MSALETFETLVIVAMLVLWSTADSERDAAVRRADELEHRCVCNADIPARP